MSVTDWTLLVGVGTFVAACATIGVSMWLNRGDRRTARATLRAAEEANLVAMATKEAIEAVQNDLAETRRLSEEVRDLEVAQRRTQSLAECERAIDLLEFAVKQGLGPRVGVEAFQSCQARIRSCLQGIPEPMPACEELASKGSPWANSAIVQDIANARLEVHNALGRPSSQ